MSVAHEVLQNVSNLPDGLSQPLDAVYATVATGVALYGINLKHRLSGEKFKQPFPNSPAAEAAIRQARDGQIETGKSRRRRLAPALAVVVGAGLAAGAYYSNPTFDNPHSDAGASEVLVLDASYSMRHTTDLGNETTRYQAVEAGLRQADDYRGKLGVMVTGAGDKLSIPLAQNWRDNLGTLKNPDVNPNGGDLAQAMKQAEDQLPLKTTSDGKQIRQGQVIVVSDGAVASSPSDIKGAIASLERSGASVKVIVPGTSDASYRIDGSEKYGAGARPELFDSLDKGDVARATSASEVASEIHDAIAETSTVHQNEPWRVPLGVGLVLLAGGVAVGANRIISRY